MRRTWVALLAILDAAIVRSLLVETNDGIVATGGVVEGFAGAGATGTALVVAALCTTVAGAIALGGARYAEEAAERDARLAIIAEEKRQLDMSPDEELAELAALYEAKGLSPELAGAVAAELSAADPLRAHVEAEHNLPVRQELRMAPLVIAAAAGVAFAAGSAIPLLAVLLTPDSWRAVVTFTAVVVSLVVSSVVLSRVGHTGLARILGRTVLVGTSAMLLSLLAGSLFHP